MWEKREERAVPCPPLPWSRDIISIDFCDAAGCLTTRVDEGGDGGKGVNFRLGSVRGWQTGEMLRRAAVKIR